MEASKVEVQQFSTSEVYKAQLSSLYTVVYFGIHQASKFYFRNSKLVPQELRLWFCEPVDQYYPGQFLLLFLTIICHVNN